MVVARTATGAFTSGTTAGTTTFGAGAAAGNLGIQIVGTSDQNPGVASGWSLAAAQLGFGTGGAAGALLLQVGYRNGITSGEASSGVAVDTTGTLSYWSAAALAYSGVDPTTPIVINAGSINGSTTATAVTSSTVALNASDVKLGDRVLAIIVTDRDSNTAATITSPAWAGCTGTRSTLINGSTATGVGGGIIVDELIPTADATGAVSFSCAITASAWACYLVVIKAQRGGNVQGNFLQLFR